MRSGLFFLSGEHATNYLSQIFLLIFVASEIGPESFGVLSFALLIQNSIHLISALNLQRFLIRDLSSKTLKSIFPSVLSIRLVLLIFTSILALTWLQSTTRSDDQNLVYSVFIISSIFLSYDLFAGYFRYHNDFKISFKINSFLTLLFIIFKIFAITYGNLQALFAVFILEVFLKFLFHLLIFYSRTSFSYSLEFVNKSYIKQLLYTGCFITVGSVFFILIRRVPPFYLEVNNYPIELGYYLFALRISEISTSINAIFADAFFPTMSKKFNKKNSEYIDKYIELSSVVFWVAILIFVTATIIAEPLLNFFNLESYLDSTKHLYPLLFATIFSSWAFLRASHLTLIKKTASQMKITILSFLTSLISLVLFINTDSVDKVAYSVIIGTFSSALLFPLLFKETRLVVAFQIKALNPLRAFYFFRKK